MSLGSGRIIVSCMFFLHADWEMESGGNSFPSGADGSKRKVCYFYHPEIGNYYFGDDHPMKPHRIRMTHALIKHYGLLQQMKVYEPKLARKKDLLRFHVDDYVSLLRNITPEVQEHLGDQLSRFNIGLDCPVFDNLYSYCRTYAGGSIGGAVMLNHGHCDIAVNWAGGMHHARKSKASGFCYVNDVVLAILELLKAHEVLILSHSNSLGSIVYLDLLIHLFISHFWYI